jgi:integrase
LVALVGWAADEAIRSSGLDVERASSDYMALCRRLARAWIGVSQPAQIIPIPTPSAPVAPPAPAPVADPDMARILAPEARKPLSKLIDEFLDGRGLSNRTAKEVHVAVRMFQEFLDGPRPIYKIRKRDVLDYVRFLQTLPANATKLFPGKSMRQAVELNAKRATPYPTLNHKTVNDKWLAHIKTLLNWCSKNAFIPDNPAANVSVQIGKRLKASDDNKDALPIDVLNQIFRYPELTKTKDYRLFAIAVALFTGARPTEIAQLEIGDIIQRDGVWLFDINDRPKDASLTKKLKTPAAKRLIPIHPVLIKVGLIDFLETAKRRKHKRLFDEWRQGTDGEYTTTLCRWFNRTLLPKLMTNTESVSFYSLRHNMQDALKLAGIQKEIKDALFGHENTTVSRFYESVSTPIAELHSAIKRVKYEGLDLTHLYV